jgi:hypothetical protein
MRVRAAVRGVKLDFDVMGEEQRITEARGFRWR